MRKAFIFVAGLVLLSGCQSKKPDELATLDQSGMWSGSLDQLKQLHVNAVEVAQLTKLKQAGASDDFCLALLKAARDHHHDFTSGEAAADLSRAGYSDAQIIEMAQADKIDVLSADAVTLKLIGLTNPTVQEIVHRGEQGQPTPSSEQIGRLKNIGLSEKQILVWVDQGLTPEEAEPKIVRLEAERNHAHTDFVRTRGRRSR